MNYTTKKAGTSQLIFTVTISPEDYATALDAAAKRLQAKMTVKGFRKGSAPLDIVKREVGDMGLLQEAIEQIVSKSYVDAIEKEGVDIIGRPEIQIEKLAPGNDIVYSATVSLLPSVKLADPKKLKIQKKAGGLDEAKFNETMDALRGMHAEEIAKDGPAEGTDKLVLDMDMKIDGVPVEGGQAKNHQVYLSENHYIPGFNEQVTGLKKGEQKTFSIDFPKDHYQSQLAGKTVAVEVTVNDVFERKLPEMTDDFAKKLGQDSAKELETIVRSNMEAEARQKADQSFEIELLDAMIDKTKFGEIPELLIEAEKQKIFHELTRDLDKHGITVEQYLGDLKKTEEELLADFAQQAEKRAKAALISREVAKQHGISPSEEEIEREIDRLKDMYSSDEETMKALDRVEVRDTIAVQLQNRAVMEFLYAQVTGEKRTEEHPDDCGCDEHTH